MRYLKLYEDFKKRTVAYNGVHIKEDRLIIYRNKNGGEIIFVFREGNKIFTRRTKTMNGKIIDAIPFGTGDFFDAETMEIWANTNGFKRIR